MEAQPVDREGEGAVSVHHLVRNSLRMRPDRIIVGEVRGEEALDMLQAMNTGHEGSLTTIHANSTREALARVELMIGLAGIDIPVLAIRKLVAASVDLIVQVSRLPGGKRKVVTISEITGMEGDVVSMHDIFEYSQTGVDKDYVVEGYFRATGLHPQCLQKLNLRGAEHCRKDCSTNGALQTMKNRGLVRMSANGDSNGLDPIVREIHTRHPGIADEIQGAIETLRKLQKITGTIPPERPEGFGRPPLADRRHLRRPGAWPVAVHSTTPPPTA